MISAEIVKELRTKTGASMMECKKALEETRGDLAAAEAVLSRRGAEIAENKAERQTRSGLVASYVHANQKIGVLLEINCETDFVARNEIFQALAHDLCLQIAASPAANVEELLEQPFIKDPAKCVRDLLNDVVGKLGENIKVGKFIRFEI